MLNQVLRSMFRALPLFDEGNAVPAKLSRVLHFVRALPGRPSLTFFSWSKSFTNTVFTSQYLQLNKNSALDQNRIKNIHLGQFTISKKTGHRQKL